MEGDDVGCIDHSTSNRGDSVQQQADLDDDKRMTFSRRNHKINHLDALGRKCLLQYGQGDDNIRHVGEATSHT